MHERHFRSLSPHGFHRVVYYEWGEPDNPRVVVCVHGLTRNGRDFDALAAALAPTHRVIAVDMPGRGQSEWLRDPLDYAFPTYLTTMTALIARCHAEEVDWVGTSMGGLLGIVLAAQSGTPLRRMVINDVGPAIEPAALQRIREYVGANPVFASYAEGERYIRKVAASFGPLADHHWEHLARSSVGEHEDGTWRLRYDPAIAAVFRANPAPPDLWSLWDRIVAEVLVLRGAESDLLSAATAAEMSARGPRPKVIAFPGVGHAPALFSSEQIAPVLEFLRA